jgi:hypothetical protein
MKAALALPLAMALCFTAICSAQTAHINIYDSLGNNTQGTLTNGDLSLFDSNGQAVFGTVKDGNVFLNSSTGNILFGTVKNGNVFLTDNQGVTTGTIRNGNIFLNNSDGSMTFGSYQSGNVFTTTIPAPLYIQPSTTVAQQSVTQQNESAGYQVGYAAGQALGNAVGTAILRHRVHNYCKKHPGQEVYLNHKTFIGTCPN